MQTTTLFQRVFHSVSPGLGPVLACLVGLGPLMCSVVGCSDGGTPKADGATGGVLGVGDGSVERTNRIPPNDGSQRETADAPRIGPQRDGGPIDGNWRDAVNRGRWSDSDSGLGPHEGWAVDWRGCDTESGESPILDAGVGPVDSGYNSWGPDCVHGEARCVDGGVQRCSVLRAWCPVRACMGTCSEGACPEAP